MPAKLSRTYGRKKKILPTTSASIFADQSNNLINTTTDDGKSAKDDENTSTEEDEQLSRVSSPVITLAAEDELTAALDQLKLHPSEAITPPQSSRALSDIVSPRLKVHLQSLLALAQADNLPLSLESWTSILPPNGVLTKIAEASFAEVYRITTSSATSIVKIMPLKHPADPASMARTFSSAISDVVPELQIMNTLTEIPGFVTFKGASIVTGNQSSEFVQAWECWGRRDGYVPEDDWPWNSDFEHPSEYGEDAVFLAIELGDAGEVLEDVIIDSLEKVWDVWLGAVVALARAEVLHEFEHRDMHENNICIYTYDNPDVKNHVDVDSLFGHSALGVTIIDYGLSRARLCDSVISFKDLETDLEVFRGKRWHRQFETYRQMRSHLYTGTLEQLPMAWHKNDKSTQWLLEAGKSWEDYVPQTNILWLSYLLDYLKIQYTAHGPAKKKSTNRQEIEEMYADIDPWLDFDPRSKSVNEERFSCAAECLDFCVEMGYINEEQLNGPGTPSRATNIRSMRYESTNSPSLMRKNNAPTVSAEVVTKDVSNQAPISITPSRQLPARAKHTFFSPVAAPPSVGTTRVLRSRTPSPVKSGIGSASARRSPSPSKSANTRPTNPEPVDAPQQKGKRSIDKGGLPPSVPKAGRNLRSRKVVDD